MLRSPFKVESGRPKAFGVVAVWPAILLMACSLVAFVWILHTQLQRLYGLTAPAWDLGQSQQLLWSLVSGHGWASSYEYDRNFLGIHLEPILFPIAGIEWLWPHPAVPLVVSAIGLAATAPAAFLMLRALLGEHPWAKWLALALAIPIPFWAATQEAARDQFHPENLALALAMLAAWAGLRRKPRLLWVLVVAVLCCKEDQTYTAFVVGLLVWHYGGASMRQHGQRVMIVAAVWLVVGAALLERLSAGAETPGLAYYWWIWQGGPNFFLIAAARPDPWLALAGLLVGLLALPLLAPRWLLLGMPPLAANLLSSHDPMERLQLHYVLIIMFPLIVAAGVGARQLLEQRALLARLPAPSLLLGAVPALIVGLAAGHLPPAFGADAWLYTQRAAADRLLAATAIIPAGAPMYADDGAVVWLSNRTRIGILYDSPESDRYVLIDRQGWAYRGQSFSGRASAIALMQANGRRLLLDDGRFQVWSPASG